MSSFFYNKSLFSKVGGTFCFDTKTEITNLCSPNLFIFELCFYLSKLGWMSRKCEKILYVVTKCMFVMLVSVKLLSIEKNCKNANEM